MNVIWHDVECGAYAEDLFLWRSLAAEHGDPVLDVGAGTGRVALDLARHGHRVTALDITEIDGVVYASQPTAVRSDSDGFVLERRRERVTVTGDRSVDCNRIRLDRLSVPALEAEGLAAGFRPAGRAEVAPTADYVGSEVVIFSA
jgi:SAM-dependent methyltransferase